MNQNKLIPFIFGGAAIIISLLTVFLQYKNKVDQPSSYQAESNISTQTTAIPSTNNNRPVTPKTAIFTLAQITTHNIPSNCWTTIDGGVYNLTSWIDQHPGGSESIISLCGIDGSDAFNAQHGGQSKPANELALFKIGTLK